MRFFEVRYAYEGDDEIVRWTTLALAYDDLVRDLAFDYDRSDPIEGWTPYELVRLCNRAWHSGVGATHAACGFEVNIAPSTPEAYEADRA